MPVPMVYRNGLLTLLIQGKTYQLGSDHPNLSAVKKALKTASDAELIKLIEQEQVKAAPAAVPCGTHKCGDTVVVFDGNTVTVDGVPLHNSLTRRVVEFAQQGLPFDGLIKFLERLSQNPSAQSQAELYDFLEHKNLPITEDGHFLAYKAVLANFLDKYSGTVDNSVGKVVTMKRGAVDDNRSKGCSAGLHCGALDYVTSYGSVGVDRIVIVKVDPADAVSVPSDCSYQKLRVCKYEVIGEFRGELAKPLYAANAGTEDFEDEDDFEDDDDNWSDFENEDEDEQDGLDAAFKEELEELEREHQRAVEELENYYGQR